MEKHWTKSLKVGDEVFAMFKYSRGNGVPLYVSKIGRKWLTLKHAGDGWCDNRVAIGTAEIDGDGYSSPGMIYRSREAYEASVRRGQAWSALEKGILGMYRGPADHISTEAIHEAARLLGLDISPKD